MLDELPEGWEAATTFHRLKRVLPRHLRDVVEARAIEDIVARARALLRHTSRPTRAVVDHFPAEGELDLERTLEQPRPWTPSDLIVQRIEPQNAAVVAILDMSLSMTGDKIALTAVAVAILRLKLDRLAVVSFDTKAHPLVGLHEDVPVREIVRRILRVPAQGFTNIEAGLHAGLESLRGQPKSEQVGIVMTDGIANVGEDPVDAASRFPRLHVVQVGPEERQGTRACTAMSRAGRGRRYRAILYSELPGVVRRLVRECFGS
jgi:Mg-chelatase subunit ChlD